MTRHIQLSHGIAAVSAKVKPETLKALDEMMAAAENQMEQEVKERPILFSSPMIRAILEGRKTQTRRIVKPQPRRCKSGWEWVTPKATWHWPGGFECCPYGHDGNRLWVRETWRAGTGTGIMFKADGVEGMLKHYPKENPSNFPMFKWRPSIFMRREYSRITLEIVNVRVERLQEISIADIQAEGIINDGIVFEPGKRYRIEQLNATRDLWAMGWDAINGKRAPWRSNPWVWCISFRRIKPK